MSAKSSSPTRRGFLSASAAGAVAVAATQLTTVGSAEAQTGKTKRDLPTIKPGTNTSFRRESCIVVKSWLEPGRSMLSADIEQIESVDDGAALTESNLKELIEYLRNLKSYYRIY